MDAKMIPPSRNDSPNSPLLYTGNDAKDIRRRGHSTPETGVERWFSVCWAGVDRRSSFGAYRCNRDTCGWVTIPPQRKRKKKRKTPRGRWWIVPLEKSRDVYLSRTLNITLSEGKIKRVCDNVRFDSVLKPGGVCCSPGSSIDVNTIGRRIVVRDGLRHRWSGFIQGERVPLPSVSLSFDPFVRRFQSADYASVWLVVGLYACVCFVYVYVILGNKRWWYVQPKLDGWLKEKNTWMWACDW